jgi:hypothetical protein
MNTISGAITTTSVTAEQVVCSGTPGSELTWQTGIISGYLTTYSGTAANLGTVFFDVNGVNLLEMNMRNPSSDALSGVVVVPFGSVRFNGSERIAWQTTPAAVTSMRWSGLFLG